MEEQKPKSINERISDLRDRICELDWSDDGVYQQGGKPIKYLSTDKIKRNLMSVFSPVGIDMTPRFTDLTKYEASGSLSQHWSVRLEVVLTDVFTGETDVSSAYGEGMDNLDKGITKAQGNAFKNWVSIKFCIADLTPETEEGMASGTYRPKSDEEAEVAKSNVLAKGIVPPRIDSKPNFVVPPTKITSSRPPEVTQVTMDNVPEKEEKDVPSAPVEVPEAPSNGFQVPDPYSTPVKRVLEDRKSKLESGAITQAQYDEVMSDYEGLKDVKGVMEFLKKHKVMI